MKKIVHKGINAYRLQDTGNRKEIVYAKAWRELNRLEPDFLKKLLGREPTENDAEIAATVIQWLGTKSGANMVEDCLKKSTGLVKI